MKKAPGGAFSVVDLGVRVRGFEFIARGQHGQPRDDPIHIEAIGVAGAGLLAGLWQAAAVRERQPHKAGARRG